jgi:hypothetical protein
MLSNFKVFGEREVLFDDGIDHWAVCEPLCVFLKPYTARLFGKPLRGWFLWKLGFTGIGGLGWEWVFRNLVFARGLT